MKIYKSNFFFLMKNLDFRRLKLHAVNVFINVFLRNRRGEESQVRTLWRKIRYDYWFIKKDNFFLGFSGIGLSGIDCLERAKITCWECFFCGFDQGSMTETKRSRFRNWSYRNAEADNEIETEMEQRSREITIMEVSCRWRRMTFGGKRETRWTVKGAS